MSTGDDPARDSDGRYNVVLTRPRATRATPLSEVLSGISHPVRRRLRRTGTGLAIVGVSLLTLAIGASAVSEILVPPSHDDPVSSLWVPPPTAKPAPARRQTPDHEPAVAVSGASRGGGQGAPARLGRRSAPTVASAAPASRTGRVSSSRRGSGGADDPAPASRHAPARPAPTPPKRGTSPAPAATPTPAAPAAPTTTVDDSPDAPDDSDGRVRTDSSGSGSGSGSGKTDTGSTGSGSN